MEYRVLGKLEVLRDGHPVDLGAFRQRALLALLLTAPNSVFSTDQILDELWGDAGGVDKQNALWVYVSGLRKALEPDREKRTDGSILLTRAPGYLIEAAAEQIDSLRFERLVTEGRALADVDPAAASLVLGESLALWRGRAFEEFTYESFAQAEIARLEELRLEAVELRVDADLQRGLSRDLISELESLVRQHPLKERMTGQLMLALYRSSRQAEALRAYQVLKSRLGEELGIEPSSWLRKLEEQIVTGDEALEIGSRAAVRGAVAQPGPAVRGYELREQIGAGAAGTAYRAYQPAVGREVAIKVIRPDLANDPAFIRRFQAEAQVIATLEHPHIVPLYDYWREPDAAYLVMRLMRGGNLASVLEHGALTSAQTMTMVDQLGNALQTAHRSGVVHGDINSDNVLLDDEGNAYLSDFGIAVGAGEVAARSDISSLGVLVAQALTGRSGGVDELRGALPDPVARVIDRAIDVDAAGHYGSVGELVDDLHEALGGGTGSRATTLESETSVDNPYKGLRAFDVVDAVDFFGRERLVERLIARLGGSGTRGRFIAVVGPSGSGKSSAVKAGLLPAIRRGAIPLSGSWFTIEMTPASHPFEQLEDALLGVAVDPPASLLEQLAGDQGLQRAVNRVLPHDGSQLLLLIDQFEELYTQVDAATANRFLANLVSAVTDEQSRIRVVATLRADFYDRPLQHRGLGELLRDGTEIVTPMTPHELERAITCPAEPHGITFEPALVAALVREVTDRPGALPLLQYTLTELFDNRRGDRVDYATYEELGGVSGTLVKRAEGLLASLGDEAHEVARQVFLRLVTFNEGGRTRVGECSGASSRTSTSIAWCCAPCSTPSVDTACSASIATRSPGARRSRSHTRRCSPSGLGCAIGSTERGTTSAFSGGSRKRCANGSPPTALRRTSCEAVSSNRCTAGSPPPQCGCPPTNSPSSRPASPNATVRRTSFSNASTGRSWPNAASGSAVVNSSSSVSWPSSWPHSRCSARCSGARPSAPKATSKICSWSTISWPRRGPNWTMTRSSPCCSRCSRCARPSTSGSRRRRRSMRCTSRSRSSESSTTSIPEHLLRSGRDRTAPSVCTPCRRTS